MTLREKIVEYKNSMAENTVQSTLTELFDFLYLRGDRLGKVEFSPNKFQYNYESIEKINNVWMHSDLADMEEEKVTVAQARRLIDAMLG